MNRMEETLEKEGLVRKLHEAHLWGTVGTAECLPMDAGGALRLSHILFKVTL